VGSNLTVSYLADVTDLRTKSALAKAELANVNSAVREQAAAFKALADEQKGPALAALQALTAQQAQLRSTISGVTKTVQEQAVAHVGLGSVLSQNRSAFMEAEHVARSLADGIASGANPMRLLAQEGGRIAQVLTELNGVNLSAVAAWGAMGAGVLGAAGALVYFGEQAVKAQRDAHELQSMFSAGNFAAPQDTILQWSYDLKAFGDLTEKESRDVIATIGRMRGATVESVQAMIDVLPLFAKRLGTDIPTAAKEMVRVLGDVNKEGAKFLEQINASTEVQNQFQKALARTDGSSFSVVLSELTRQALAFGDAEKHAIAQASELSSASYSASNKAPRGGGGQEGYNLALQAERAQQASQDVAAALAKADTMQGTVGLDAFRLKAQAVADDLTKTSSQKAAAIAAIWDQAVASGRLAGEQLTQAEREQTAAHIAAATRESSEIIRLAEITAERRAAASGPDRAGQVRAEIETYQETLNSAKLTADDKEELENRVAQLQVQLVRRTATEAKKAATETWESYKAGIDKQLEDAKGNYAEQIKLIQQEVQEAQKLYGDESRQAMEAEKAEAEVRYQAGQAALKSIEEQLAAQRELAKAEADMQSIGAKPAADTFKPSIGVVFDHSALNSAVSAEVAELAQALNVQLAALQAEITGKLNLAKTLDAGSADYGSLVTGAATALSEMSALQKQYADQVIQINKQAASTVSASWAEIGQPIEGAFSKIVGAAIGGGRNTAQAMDRAAIGVVQSWAKSAIESVAHVVAMQLGMTGATAAGQTARNAIANDGTAKEIQALTQQVAKFIAAETAKTGAAVTASTTQAAAQTTAATAGATATAAAAKPSILASAGKAAAAVYAGVAEETGPLAFILAPAAAAAAFVAVAGYQTVASAEGGWDRVPYDGAMTELHKNEMVLPASVAQSVRDMANARSAPALASAGANAGSTSTVNNIGGNTHSASFQQTNHFYGETDANQGLREKSAELVHDNLNHWYGNTGTPTLPGRQVRK
jgi:hypothetical protein